MNHPIKTVIFDLGKVLLDFDWNRTLQKISAASPFPPEEISQLVENDGAVIDFETGKVTSADFFQRQKKTFQFAGSWEDLRDLWCDIFTPIESNVTLAREIAGQSQVGLLSNTNEAHINFFESKFDFISIFPERIYSCRVGYMKPRREIYEAIASRLQLVPDQTVFIDDSEANVAAAGNLGWNSIHLRPGIDLRSALGKFDFLVPVSGS